MNWSNSESEETASIGDSSLTEEMSSVSSSDVQEELNVDFTDVWRHLREVLQVSNSQRMQCGTEYPKLTDMVQNSHDCVFRPNTVVMRVYPIGFSDQVEHLPPISLRRKGLTALPQFSRYSY